ncbi:hypothetical protein [Aquabacterium sp. OR-4]|uniref:hypothetical protein n=1 Tax=Aquabacterium sp. OR-4 TaxID=2978127 RepID=UPI0028C574E3|nr:hypothetical protein [Aquabacterium sp. OR-4]MDT7833622.1 hypothetical protein [Aquabacterium sp. OR-4]
MTPGLDLAGRLLLCPGPCAAPIRSTRPQGLQRVALGQRAEQLPTLMAALHALCAHAHRLAARLAVRAARGEPGTPTTAERLALQAGTARDQLLRLAHDWPRLLPGAEPFAPALAEALRSCPLWRPGTAPAAALATLPDWLAQHWLGQSPARWLAAWADDPLAWPARWAQRQHTPLARLLAAQQAATQALATPPRPWQPLAAAEGAAAAVGAALAGWPAAGGPAAAGASAEAGASGAVDAAGADPGAEALPDTGPWSRHHDRLAPAAHNAWMRLVSRLVDLLQLASPAGAPHAPGGADWLAAGAASPAPGEGLAWVETARGLLAYRVALAADDGSPAGPRLQALQVLAPTDWNFHPQGVLARALQAQAAGDAPAATRLAVAFDPCVAFTVAAAALPAHPHEAQHA